MSNQFLTFDVGGTKTAWALISEDGTMGESGTFPTPTDRTLFLDALRSVLETYQEVRAVGIGIAGIVSPDHRHSYVCPNIPGLSHLEIAEFVEDTSGVPCALENDGRCALLGEAWLGAAKETSSVVMLTIGTGIGGAVMQRNKVLPHPTDLSHEISHLVADPQDLFASSSGRGTIEALIGGKNLAERYELTWNELTEGARSKDAEILEVWEIISDAFASSIQAIFATYACRTVIIGGRGMHDLALYMGDHTFPCTVIPAVLGEQAGLYGAAQIARERVSESNKDWDE